jgi:uncharacterized protein
VRTALDRCSDDLLIPPDLLFSIATTGYILLAIQFEERDLVATLGDLWAELKQEGLAECVGRCAERRTRRRSLARALALCGMADTVVVKVKPGSPKGPRVEVGSDGELTIYVREPAVDGKANKAVMRLLAAHLQLPRSRVELVSGATSRLKRFRVCR